MFPDKEQNTRLTVSVVKENLTRERENIPQTQDRENKATLHQFITAVLHETLKGQPLDLHLGASPRPPSAGPSSPTPFFCGVQFED